MAKFEKINIILWTCATANSIICATVSLTCFSLQVWCNHILTSTWTFFNTCLKLLLLSCHGITISWRTQKGISIPKRKCLISTCAIFYLPTLSYACMKAGGGEQLDSALLRMVATHMTLIKLNTERKGVWVGVGCKVTCTSTETVGC